MNEQLYYRQIHRDDLEVVSTIDAEIMNPVWTELNILTAIEGDEWLNFLYFIEENSVNESPVDESPPVGFLFLRIEERAAKVYKLGVREKYQGRGIGEIILDHAMALAVEADVPEIYLEVASHNIRALSLYRKYGFQRIGIRRGYYEQPPDDALVMNLELSLKD